MKRILFLAILGLIIAVALWAYFSFKGGVHRALGIGMTFRWEVTRRPEVVREVSISGPTVVTDKIIEVLGFTSKNGWEVTHPEIVEAGDPSVLAVRRFRDPHLDAWELTEWKVRSASGVFRRKYEFRETFKPSLLDKLKEARKTLEQEKGESEATSLWEQFLKALGETKERADFAAIKFVAEAPVTLIVEMPGRIQSIKGASLVGKNGRAKFSGKLRELSNNHEVIVVSTETRISGIVLCIIILVALAGGFIWWYRRRIRAKYRRIRTGIME